MSVSSVLYSMPALVRASRKLVESPDVCPEPEPLETHSVDAQPKTFTRLVDDGNGSVWSSLRTRTIPSPSICSARVRPSSMVASSFSPEMSTLPLPR